MTPERIAARSNRTGLSAATVILVLLPAMSAQAYVGPGAGVSAIGTIIALVFGILLAVVGFVWYPFKRLLRSLRSGAESTERGAEGSKRSE